MARKELTPHQKIVRAYRKGWGLRLTRDEVACLFADDAIRRCADNDDQYEERIDKAVEWWNERVPWIQEQIAKDRDQNSQFKWTQLVWQEIQMYCKIGNVEDLEELCRRRGFNKTQRIFLRKALGHVGLL